jgi:integrase
MDAELRACLERLAAERGLAPGIPVAGHWSRGNQHRDLCAAARRSGLGPILDDRGRTHLLSANDLRRTAATWLAEGLARRGSGPDKSATEVIAEFLGHAGLDVARGIYDRASGPRLGIVTSVFNELRAGRRGPKAVESVSHPQLAALPERK